jgi:hypothetical protein
MESSCRPALIGLKKKFVSIFTQKRKFNFVQLLRKMFAMNTNISRITLSVRIQEYTLFLQ